MSSAPANTPPDVPAGSLETSSSPLERPSTPPPLSDPAPAAPEPPASQPQEAHPTRAAHPVSAPATHRAVIWASRVLTGVAALWFFLAAAWEINGPFGAGHVASSTSVGIAGENMWKWHVIGPVLSYTLDAPTSADYYCNHPWGIFWTTALFTKLFGHHDFVCRLAPVLMSAASPLLLYGVAKRVWGHAAGAIAAMSFVVLPIALAFANFNALEVPVIFGVLVATYGYVRFSQSWRRRWMLLSVLGLTQALNADWAAFIFGAVVLVLMLPRGVLLNGVWFRPVDRRRFAQWWALSACAAVGTLMLYLYLFQDANKLSGLLAQGNVRSTGWKQPLSSVLESRAYWIEVCFTPIAILIGKLAVPLLCLRVILLRRDLELFPLAILLMAVLQYIVFKQGADVHIFWPHYFAPYFALAMAAICGSIEGSGRFLIKKLRWGSGAFGPPLTALALSSLVPLAILPDGIDGLRLARDSGGRFDEKGLIIHSDIDKSVLMKWLSPRLESRTSVSFDDSMKYSWSLGWSLERPVWPASRPPSAPKSGEQQYYMTDARFASGGELKQLADDFSISAFESIYFVDRSAPYAPGEGFVFSRREPGFFEWYFQQGHDPIVEVVPDPFATWELRDQFDQTPNPDPVATPSTREHQRILHNLAVQSGNTAVSERLFKEILQGLDRKIATNYQDGTEILGSALEPGVAPRLIIYMRALGPTKNEMSFDIRSQVEAVPWYSTISAEQKVRVVGMPFSTPSTLWKQGYIYTATSEIRKRPGKERFVGALRGRGLGADRGVDLFTLE